MRKTGLILLVFCLSLTNTFAQQPPFWEDIQKFKKQDSISFPAANQILFVGSSSFTLWKDVQRYFPSKPIINRGFGGSSLPDVIRYAPDIILPYKPKQVVIYCGENDFAAAQSIVPDTVVGRLIRLFHLIRTHYPKIPIAYVSMKPSPSRLHLMPKFEEANKKIKAFLNHYHRTSYINVYKKMLDRSGRPFPHIFLKDSLHMNAEGYKIWQKKIAPVLK